jgi:hypothetical protein
MDKLGAKCSGSSENTVALDTAGLLRKSPIGPVISILEDSFASVLLEILPT